MLNRRTLFTAVVLPASLLIGCSSSNSSTASSSAATQPAAAAQPAAVPIPADSPFAKVRNGESMQEVQATIGPPTSQNAYLTGKSWIPFHEFSGDNSRICFYYKGIGNIVFSKDSAFTSGHSVIEVNYDPTEPGYPQ